MSTEVDVVETELTEVEKENQEETVKPSKTIHEFFCDVDSLLKFLFPAALLHPKPSRRLFLFAEYGPLFPHHSYATCLCIECQHLCRDLRKDNKTAYNVYHGALIGTKEIPLSDPDMQWLCEDCVYHCLNTTHLKAGFRNQHVVSDHEMHKMETSLERTDLLSCFVDPKEQQTNPLAVEEEEELIRSQPMHVKHMEEFTKQELVKMFSILPADSNGCYRFHDMSRLIRECRQERKEEIIRRSNARTEHGLGNKRHVSQAMPSFALDFSNSTKKLHRVEEIRKNASLLHYNRHKISSVASKTSFNATANANLLRFMPHDSSTEWNGVCCLSGCEKGTRVKMPHLKTNTMNSID